MPFSEQTPRPFTEAGINEIPELIQGVYGLYSSSRWIYVGKGFIRDRLQRHLNGDNECITRWAPNDFLVETSPISMDEREKALILELSPVCNERVG